MVFLEAAPDPIFLLNATLMIPAVTVKPNLDDVQEALTSVGKIITSVAKGVAQWNSRGGKVKEHVKIVKSPCNLMSYPISRCQNMWKGLPYSSKKNLANVVLRVQNNTVKEKQQEPEDMKARRRRLYKIHSEERPVFPTQERNFYTMVMDNKEIVKLLGMLSTCTIELRQVLYSTVVRHKTSGRFNIRCTE